MHNVRTVDKTKFQNWNRFQNEAES